MAQDHRPQGTTNEAYTGSLVWGQKARDGQEPVRVENAFPAIVSTDEFDRARRLMEARAPKVTHPRRAASPYLLSGLARCENCNKALTAAEAKSGRYTYYVCQSLLKQGSGTCDTPRLNARNFEDIIVANIRENVLTESNIRELVVAFRFRWCECRIGEARGRGEGKWGCLTTWRHNWNKR